MTTKIGITRNPEDRKAYVEMIYRTAKNWQILGTFENHDEAASAMGRLAAQLNCQTLEDREEAAGDFHTQWYVYSFTHGKQPRIKDYGGIKMLDFEKNLKKK